jgi:hypothetical protein
VQLLSYSMLRQFTVGAFTLLNKSSGEIFCKQPQDLRIKRNDRARRNRLEAELALAVRQMDFRRAQVLKDVIYGDQPTYMIWHREHSAYYRSGFAGYTTDTIVAGRYTFDEAMGEVRRVPHLLEAVSPTGERLRAKAAA